MNIAIIGTGSVGQIVGGKLMEAGHQVVYGTRDVDKTLARTQPDGMGNPAFSVWHKEHASAKLQTFEQAAAQAELVINATGGMVSLQALESAGKSNLDGKVLIDIANPLDFSQGFPPSLSICNTDSLGEQIQSSFPGTKVVKALNTMSAHVMVAPEKVPGEHNLFLCGNDEEAKAQVSTLLVEALGWKRSALLDLGDISMARGTEMLLPIWVRLYGHLQNPIFNFHVAQGEAPA